MPDEHGCHDRFVFAVFVVIPILLPNRRLRTVAPEIDSLSQIMGEPDGLMVIMIGRPGVSHSGEGFAGGAIEREEERPWIVLSEIPAELFNPVDAHGDLVIIEGDHFAAWNGKFGVFGLRGKKAESSSENHWK